jgi:hypothetical protein
MKAKKKSIWEGITMGKMDMQISTKLLVVVGCILALLLWASPCRATTVPSGQTLDVDGTVTDGYVVVYGTLNLYPGADVDWVYAYGGTVNVYGGQVAGFLMIDSSDPNPIVTVYGSGFAMNGKPLVDENGRPLSEFTLDSGYLGVLTGTYENGDPIDLGFYVYGGVPIYLAVSAPKIMVDIKPGSDTNVINLNSKGVVPVAVLTTDVFDARQIDPATVLFAGAAPVRWTLEDVDGDGDLDMLFHFNTQELNLNASSTTATLTARLKAPAMMSQSAGQTNGGSAVSGTDKVRVLSSKK